MIKLLGRPVAQAIQKTVFERTLRFTQTYRRPPHLAVILVGSDPASQIYTRKKGEMAVSLGMSHHTYSLSEDSSPAQLKELVFQLNENPKVDGILIQRPLPRQFVEQEVLFWVAPEKDVDAFHPLNAGKLQLGLPTLQPCTPTGVMSLLQFYQIHPAGKIACVIGRSSIVGKPMATLLTQANATVIQCHSQTPHIQKLSQQADILVVAAGKPGLVDASYVKKGAVVIDVGIHRVIETKVETKVETQAESKSEGKIIGDVQFESVSALASALTPVPGGVGVMTIALLMQNTLTAAEQRASQS